MTSRRDKLLGQARADLTQLPDLCDELMSCLTERGPAIGKQGKVSGSPALIRLDVFRLIDSRRKNGWEGEDPRYTNLTDWLGVAPLLESWVRVLCDDLPGNIELTEDEAWVRTIWGDLPAVIELTETATVRSEADVLVEFWPFIEAQQWGEELAKDVSRAAQAVRAALGIKPEYRPRCRKCKSTVIPVDADRKLTTWEACAYGACTGCDWTYPKGPALDALGQVQEPMPLREIASLVGLPLRTLQRWVTDGLIAPLNAKRRGRVFDLATVRAVATVKFGRHVDERAG